MIPAVALALAYGGYSALRLGSELRYLQDYKRRYPWVNIRYPGRTAAFKSLNGGMFAVSYGRDPIKKIYK